jgi:membrane-associated protein
MEWLSYLIEFVLHLDKHLYELVIHYGVWVYGLLFIIIFAETGLVVMPLLPGDSLLFAAGAVAATGGLNPHLLVILLIIAAISGDTVNYWIGYYVGPKVFSQTHSRLFNPQHLQRTHHFYQKHGGKTVIIARFLPIIRTFAPFVAGVGAMGYLRFLMYSITGGTIWVSSFIYMGYFFGNLPIVKNNFSIVILMIIVISLIPPVIEFLKHRHAVDVSDFNKLR